MITISVRDYNIEIHPIAQDNLEAILNLYKQCEDFLALGPVSTASMEMVRKDIEISKEEGGIYKADGEMIGLLIMSPVHANKILAMPSLNFL